MAISHFDGAVRAYATEAYFQRIDTSIDRAGKHSDYTKLFRFDGPLSVADWKRLLSDFFRGNKLIPEYLGAPVEIDDEDDSEVEPPATASSESVATESVLSAFVHLDNGSLDGDMALFAELCQELDGELIPYVEVGTGAVETYLRSRIDFSNITTIGADDGILNLSRLIFGSTTDLKEKFALEVPALAASLQQDVEAGTVLRASIPMVWETDQLLVTLSVVGDAEKVAVVLAQIPSVIDPTQAPSEWIEALSALVKAIAPKAKTPVMWHGLVAEFWQLSALVN